MHATSKHSRNDRNRQRGEHRVRRQERNDRRQVLNRQREQEAVVDLK